jgi:hypothetical protein
MRSASSAGARPASESLSRRNPRETGAELSRGYGDLVFSGVAYNMKRVIAIVAVRTLMEVVQA